MKHRREKKDEAQKPQVDLGEDQTFMDPYEVLDLPRQASLDDIKQAYFAQVRQHPPERAPAMFKRIRAAYDMLRTPEAKAATDLFLVHPPQPYEQYRRAPSFDLDFHEADWWLLARAYADLGRVDFRSDFEDVDL